MKLYISDLDGTLLNENMALSNESINTLNQLIKKGVNFSFATARSIDSVLKIMKPLNLKLPFIIFNGVAVFDPVKNEYLRKNFLESQLAINIIEDVKLLNPFIFINENDTENSIYHRQPLNSGQYNFINSPVNKGEKSFKQITTYDFLNSQHEYISIACIDKKENLLELYNKYSSNPLLEIHLTEDVYQNEFYWLEFAKKGSTKKDAIIFLKEYLNATSLITFGDNLNDISMFTIADKSYAVSNAHHDLKKIANEIIGSNLENSVVKKIHSDFFNL